MSIARKTIAVVDSGIGNFGSLITTISRVQSQFDILRTSNPLEIREAHGLIFPGVGAFEIALGNMRQQKLDLDLRSMILDHGIPVLGICLGMHMLVEGSEEHGWHDGLGFLPGCVKLLPVDTSCRLPHVGWNQIQVTGANSRLLEGVDGNNSFYFDHGFAIQNAPNIPVSALCDYGSDFVAAVEKGNIMGVQFHPEMSGTDGERILRNFLDVVGAL